MTDSFQYGDIVLLGILALFIALRLRAMLGRQTGIDPREIWRQAVRDTDGDKNVAGGPAASSGYKMAEEGVFASLKENSAATGGLKAIKLADPSFSPSEFLNGARLAFEWVVSAFAQGDKEKLKARLSDERFVHFAADIDARKAQGATLETTLVSVIATDITEALLQGNKAHVTVQFTTEQVSVTRDAQGATLAGDPSAIERVIDVWTFEREVTSRDPNWKIVAT